MQIKARVALSLPNDFYKVELKYDTFEKATFDSYLIAALIKNTKEESQAMDYIDAITGNGSLNPHFKKEYKKISVFSEEQIDDILNNSEFPITVIDTKNHFKFYPMLNASQMNGRVYLGNLADYPNLSDMLMSKDDGIKFRGMELEEEPGIVREDMYDVIFTDKDIQVDLDNDTYCSISKDDFLSVFHREELDMSDSLMPIIGNKISEGNWSVLTNEIISSWRENPFAYKDRDGNLSILMNDSVKAVEVINVFDLLFYKETKYVFSKTNASRISSAIEYLISSGKLNTFKTKTLVQMLSFVHDFEAQEVIEYVLARKDSKELAELGFKLIENGLEKGWRTEILKTIKRFSPASESITLYKINPNLGFTIDDFLNISDEFLIEEHLKETRDFLLRKSSMVQRIREMIGEMAEIREKAKKLQKNNVVKDFNAFANKYIGHSRIKYDELPMDKLEKEFEYIQSMYNGNYQKVKAALEKLDR